MTRILRLRQVCELTGLSASTIWRRERAGDFPRRLQLGANSVGWLEDEILEWIRSRERGGCAAPEAAIGARTRRPDR